MNIQFPLQLHSYYLLVAHGINSFIPVELKETTSFFEAHLR